MSETRRDRSGLTLAVALFGITLFVAGGRLGKTTNPPARPAGSGKVARATVPEPSSVVSASLGVIAVGALYAYQNRRRLRPV